MCNQATEVKRQSIKKDDSEGDRGKGICKETIDANAEAGAAHVEQRSSRGGCFRWWETQVH